MLARVFNGCCSAFLNVYLSRGQTLALGVGAFSAQRFRGEGHGLGLGLVGPLWGSNQSELLLVMRRFLKKSVIVVCLMPRLVEGPCELRKGSDPVSFL